MPAMGGNKQRTYDTPSRTATPPRIPPTPSWPAGAGETLIRLWNAGLSGPEIASRFGVTARAVESKVRKLRVAGHALAERRARAPRRAQRAVRKCLYCGAMFASAHIGNRLCPMCLEEGPFTSAMV